MTVNNIKKDYFCSQSSVFNNEFIYGTASNFQYWVLLEYTKPWSENPIEVNRLPILVNEYLRSLTQILAKSRVLFVKQNIKKEKNFSLFLIVSKENNIKLKEFVINEYKDLLDIDIVNMLRQLEKGDSFLEDNPIYLVCTNGKKDKCCSKFGIPIYKMFSNTVKKKVWQCTHIGGDRFAPNVVCFPSGIYYGQVETSEITEIVSYTSNDRIYLNKFRGRSCFGQNAQVGEFFIRRRNYLKTISDLIFFDEAIISEKIFKVRFINKSSSKIYETIFNAYPSKFRLFTTCNALKENNVTQYTELNYTENTFP